jgi:ATP-binding cassette subfamily B protein
MKFLRLYLRVLGLLGREARLGWILALANLALASAMFVEPLLFGRIIDTLANAQARVSDLPLRDLMLLLGAWVGFALFAIVCSTLVALHADRLAHRQYQVVRTMFFEHVLQLPLSYYTGSHSGRLVKVMMTGTNTLWALWLAFFREHFASFVSLIVLMPLTLFINWRYGLLLIALCCVFAMLIALVVSKSEKLQSNVERYYSDVAERTTDTLGNIALVQSFARIESEVSGMKKMGDDVLSAQIPVLSWWAVTTVITRTSTTLTMLSILVLGVWFYLHGLTTVGEIVMFMSYATLLIGRLEHVVQFANRMVMDAPRIKEFFEVLDTEPAVRDRPDALDPGRLHGLVEFKDVSFSYDGKRAAVADLTFTALPGETVALVGATGAGKSTALALLHRAFDPQSGVVRIDGMDIRALTLTGLRRNIGVVFQEVLLFNRSIAENLRVGRPDATEEELRTACERAQGPRGDRAPAARIRDQCRRARPAVLRRRAPTPVDRARTAQGSPDPHPR